MTYQEPKGIAKEILSYFLRNPQAADNLEGVARWRLLEQTVHRSVEETAGDPRSDAPGDAGDQRFPLLHFRPKHYLPVV